ncbi:MAG: ankyrin repeat domain-containing protein, partial [Phycisphaerales bacterium]|nr:ankyrin repeat domain-containing protein [Phycisphaerales bacterium]
DYYQDLRYSVPVRTIVTLLASLALAHAGELHQAARACDADRMRQLLSRHPSLNETDENGMTPLHIAIDSRQRACVWLLLEAGADRRARDRQSRTAFDAAVRIADPVNRMAIDYMLRNFGRETPGEPMGPMPWSLEYSVMRRQTGVTKMLLALGADPNATGTGGTTPLADAALKGDLDGVRALLAHGARPNAISQAGTQPIHDAALGDNAEVIRELVMQGADVNARTRDEVQTPLHIAAAMGKMKAVEALVALGADLTIKDSKGRAPLDAAERVGLTNVVAFLKRAAAAK